MSVVEIGYCKSKPHASANALHAWFTDLTDCSSDTIAVSQASRKFCMAPIAESDKGSVIGKILGTSDIQKIRVKTVGKNQTHIDVQIKKT